MNKLFQKGVSGLLTAAMVGTYGFCAMAQDLPVIPEQADTAEMELIDIQLPPEDGAVVTEDMVPAGETVPEEDVKEEPVAEEETETAEEEVSNEEETKQEETVTVEIPAGTEAEQQQQAAVAPLAAAVSSVSIEGTLKPGYTLTAVCEGGEGALTYQWSSSTSEGGSYTDIDGATAETLTLKNAQGNRYVKVTVSAAGADAVESDPVKIDAALGKQNAVSTALPGAVAFTPDTYKFQVKGNGRVFSLLQETEDEASKYFISAVDEYGTGAFDMQNQQPVFDPESEDNIAWMLNNVLTGKEESWPGLSSTPLLLPSELVPYIDMEHQWLTEATIDTDDPTKAVRTSPDDYVVTCGVALMSLTEYREFCDRIGYQDQRASTDMFFRTSRGDVARAVMLSLFNKASDAAHGRIASVDGNAGSNKVAFRPVFYLNNDFFSSVALDVTTMGDTVKQTIMKNYTVDQLGSLYTQEELEVIGFVNLPEAHDVSVAGAAAAGQTLRGSYTYDSPNGAAEGDSTFRWLVSDSADGEFTAIPGATEQSWTIEPDYVGKYIKFEVIPRNETVGGMAAASSAIGPVRAEQAVTVADMQLDKTGAVAAGDTITLTATVKSDVAQDLYGMIAVYDAQQQMVDAIFAPMAVTAGTGEYTLKLEAEAAGEQVSAVILDSEDSLRPLAALGASAGVSGAASGDAIGIEQSASDYSVMVRGTIADAVFNNLVFVYVTDAANQPIYAAAVTADSNSGYAHQFHMPAGTASGDYTIYAGAYDKTGEPYSMPFYYANQAEVESVYGQVSALASAAAIQEFLNTGNHQAVLGLSNPFFAEVPLAVCEKLAAAGAHNDPASFKQLGMTEMAVQALLQKGTSLEAVEEIAVFFDAYFNFQAEKNYAKYEELISDSTLGEGRKDAILSGFIDAGCETMEQVRTRFNELVVLQMLAETTDYSQVEELLKTYEEDLTIDLQDEDFQDLKDTGIVYAGLVGQRFTSAADFADRFDELVSDQLEKENPPKNNGSSGSSGGSSGGGSSRPGISIGGSPVTPPDPYGPINPEPEPEPPLYSDLDSVAWAEASITALSEKQIVQGYGDGTFLPNNTITREEFVKLVVTAFGLETGEAAEPAFEDVEADSWYAPYLAAAKEAGIVEGYADGTFGVGAPISRQDIAVMLYRAAEDMDKTLSTAVEEATFADEAQIGEYAAAAVKALQMAGVISGTPEGNFEPVRNATRAEACVMVDKLINGGALQ